ncbi:uncharacterized protein LOC129298725 isoform X2 [Prosopis cineraria]|uniref:uncharacterized protein LOC129298725 isoform X2 n=1 Tax=Prosopis cineraria TaxID=364024 RepID=UPI00240FC156|nr:uncharacterized protein LOC129298725 isoform X2 [Prosopis cineraria]
MDHDICRWILEFLLRSSIPDSIVKKIFKLLPFSDVDSRLRKTLVLRDVQSEVAAASLTENLLACLEVIEEINKLDGIAITTAMKEAYCAVAVQCTVKYLDACPHKNTNGLFDDAVNRIWRGRVRKMMEAVASGMRIELLTAELIGWKDVIESCRWDEEVCQILTKTNTKEHALDKVRVYLKETWASMGPSFLELAAASTIGGSQALGGTDMPQRINRAAIQKGKLPLEHDHGLPHTRRGVHFTVAEKAGPTTMCSEDHSASTIQVKKLRKSLISSSLDLQAVVKDPLPDAVHNSDIVGSELASKGVNREPPFENQSAVVDAPEQNTCKSMVLYQPIDDILKKQYSADCSNVQRPSLMQRNSTAHTYKDDSFNDLPGGSPKKRRRQGKWSSEEEDALRAGVKKFGKGNWRSIRKFYSEIFTKTGRTEVDLKDKWRNLTRLDTSGSILI